MKPLLIALLMLLGWLNASHFSPWVSWHSEVPFFFLTFAVALYGIVGNTSKSWVSVPRPVKLALVLAGVVVVQRLLGIVAWTGQAIVVLLYLAVVVVSITWGWREAHSIDGVHPSTGHCAGQWLAWVLIVGGIASIGVALAQVLQVWEGVPLLARQAYIRRPGGNFAQPNHLATLLVMSVAAALFLRWMGKLAAPTLVLLLLVFNAGIAVTESRSGLLSALIVYGFWAWRRPGVDSGLTRPLALIPAATVLILFLVWPVLYRSWTGGLILEAGVERIGAGASDPRWTLWRQLYEASWLHPWLGWGFRDTAEAHNAVAHDAFSSLPVTYSHNLVLDFVLWLGWPTGILVIILIGHWAWTRIGPASLNQLGWFGCAVLIPFAVHSMFEFPYAYAYFLVPAMLAVGYVERAARPNDAVMKIPRSVAYTAVGVLLLSSVIATVDYLRAEENFRVALFELLKIGNVSKEPPPKIILLDQLDDMVASTRVLLHPGMKEEDIDRLRMAALHYPWSGSQYRYAMALAFNDSIEEARRQMQVLKAQHGMKVYQVLAAQLERNMAEHGLPVLGLQLEGAR